MTTPPIAPAPAPIEPQREVGPPGLAVASIIVSGVGLCLPLCGIAGIILGAFGLRDARRRSAPPGLAIGGIVVGAVGTLLQLMWLPMCIGVTLPAMSSARDAAREIRASVAAQQVLAAIEVAKSVDATPPPRGSDFVALLEPYLPPEMWEDPSGPSGGGAPFLLLIYDDQIETADGWPTHVMVNPALRARRGVAVATSASSETLFIDNDEADALLRRAAVYAPDGVAWTPPPTSND